MPRAALPAVLLIAGASVAWFVLRERPVGDDAVPVERPPAPNVAPAPALRVPPPSAASGSRPAARGGIRGVVRADGVPTGAQVEVRLLAEARSRPTLFGGSSARNYDAIVSGRRPGGASVAVAQAGADGTFRFDDLAPGAYALYARTDGGARGTATTVVPAVPTGVFVSIDVILSGEVLRGRIVFADGSPFSGWVSASSQGRESWTSLGATADPITTDAEGRFLATGLAAGPVTVTAGAHGFAITGPPTRVPREDEYLLTIGTNDVAYVGRVVAADTGEPIAGATVVATGGNDVDGFVQRAGLTDAAGRFRASAPPGPRSHVMARAEGFASAYVMFPADPAQEVVLALGRGGTLTGRVVSDEDGSPVAGVEVHAVSAAESGFFDVPTPVRSGPDGRFSMPVTVSGVLTVFVLDEEWCSPRLPSGRTDAFDAAAVALSPGGTAETEVRVVRAGAVAGRVKDAGGAGIGGALVRLDRVAGPGGSPWMRGLWSPEAFDATVSDEQGSFRLGGVVPEVDHVVVATAAGRSEAKSEPFQAASGEVATADVLLGGARWLDVALTSAKDGSPIAGARVRAGRFDRGSYEGLPQGWTTDPAGRARVGPLPPGPIAVIASAPGFAPLSDIREVPPPVSEGRSWSHAIALEPGLVIAGRVTGPPGLPLVSVSVFVAPRPSRGVQVSSQGPPSVGTDGRFRDDTFGPGTYEIRASVEWKGKSWSARGRAEAGGDEVVLALTDGGDGGAGGERSRVRVLDAHGAPLSSGWVTFHSFGSHGGSGSTAGPVQEGLFAQGSAGPDDEVWVGVDRVPSGRGGSGLFGPYAGSQREIEVRLGPARGIAGRVEDGSGGGVRAVRVEARASIPGRSVGGYAAQASVTGADGSFSLDALGDGDWSLSVLPPPDLVRPEPRVVAGGARGVRFVLDAGVAPTLTIVDVVGRPVAGAAVLCSKAQAKDTGGGRGGGSPSDALTSDGRGVVRLGGLDAKVTYTLRVNPPSGREDLLAFERDRWSPAGDETIVLEAGGAVAGRVVDPAGRPLAAATVHWQGADAQTGSWSGMVVREDGTFRLPGLRGRAVRIYAEVRRAVREPGPPASERAMTVAIGATDVVLTVDPGLSIPLRLPPDLRSAHATSRVVRGERTETQPVDLARDGTAHVRGLARGDRVSIWISIDDRFALLRDLEPREEVIVVQLEVGLTVKGRLVGPDGGPVTSGNVTVEVLDRHGPRATADAEGRFEVHGVPPGTWSVTGYAQGLRGQAQVVAGGSVDIDLVRTR